MNDHRQQHNWPGDDPGDAPGQWPGSEEPVPQWPGAEPGAGPGAASAGAQRPGVHWPTDDEPARGAGRQGWGGQHGQWPGTERPRREAPPPRWPGAEGPRGAAPPPHQSGPPRGGPQAGWPQGPPPAGHRGPYGGGQRPPYSPGTSQGSPVPPPWGRGEQPHPDYPDAEQPTGHVPPVEDSGSYEPGLLTHLDGYDDRQDGHDDHGYAEHREGAGYGPDDSGDDGSAETAHAHGSGQRGKAALTAKQRRRRRWRVVRRTLYALFGIFVVLPALAFTITYFFVEVPTPEQVAADQGQVITYKYADGSVMGKVAPADGGNRVLLEQHEIPERIKHAAYAAEDATFETNPGFDVTGIMRAAWSQVTGGAGGGSTISQQYVKQATGYDDYSYVRKFVEVVKSFKMNNQQSKAEIITGYLNTVYLGRGAYGIQAAAQAYFGTDIGKLTPSQAALLAGMIQQPSRFDDQQYMKDRWNYVLDQMVANNWLSPAKRKAAEFPDMIPIEDAGPKGISGPMAFVQRQVNAELAAKGYPEKKLQSGGYTIHTTIDPRAQKHAKQAVKSVMGGQPKNLSEAFVAVDPQNGAVRAYYGGPNSKQDSVNGAATTRNPGSSFKPFDLVALLHTGQGLAKTYDGTSPRKIAGHEIHNAGASASCSTTCTVAKAMEVSANTVFVDMVVNTLSPQAVQEAAHQAGIPLKYRGQPTTGNGYNIAIGGGNTLVTPTMMASAYASFAAGGVRHDTHFVNKLAESDGEVVYKANTEGEPAFAPNNPELSKKIAGNVTRSLEPVLPHSSLSCPPGYDCAGKTGTDEATGSKTGTNQAWMVGYSPTISAAAWVGSLKGPAIEITDAAGRPIYGSDLPGAIWEKFMQSYLPATPKKQFPEVELIGKPLQPTYNPVNRDANPGAREEDTQDDGQQPPTDDSEDTTTVPPSSEDSEPTMTRPTEPVEPTMEPPPPGEGEDGDGGGGIFDSGDPGNGQEGQPQG